MTPDTLAHARRIVANPAAHADDPALLAAAFLTLVRAQGRTPDLDNLHGALCTARVRTRAVQLGRTGPLRLICPGAVT